MNKKFKTLFEISWEVCHKDGGIYTVISSKANILKQNIENYYFIGALRDNINDKNSEFLPEKCPIKYLKAKQELEQIGIKLHFGTWKINGYPNAILIEYLDHSKNINSIKTELWEQYKIDSLNSQWNDFDEVILWSWCAGIVIEKLTEIENNNILIQSHEWMSGGAILYLKTLKNKNKFKTIFTTHATMLGRAISGSSELDFIKNSNFNPDDKAYEIGVQTKHQTEKALANISDCFTTVSNITGNEAEFFYNKKPDVLLYNGFDNNIVPNFEGLKVASKISRDETNLFLKKYFWNFYDFDIENSKIFFTSGRNEFKNKGWDLYINSLGKLNEKLISENSNKEIINLFLIPIGNFQIDENYQKSVNNYNNKIKLEKNEQFAPLSTHIIPTNNEIIKSFIDNKLLNRKQDKIKVILIPLYLDGNNEVINQRYYEMILGLDLSIFVSYYEPWGYTPMESISFGVPTITTNRAGFGRYILNSNKLVNDSVNILDTINKNFQENSENLKNILYNYNIKNNNELLQLKNKSLEFAKNFDWHVFIENYYKAFEIALNK